MLVATICVCCVTAIVLLPQIYSSASHNQFQYGRSKSKDRALRILSEQTENLISRLDILEMKITEKDRRIENLEKELAQSNKRIETMENVFERELNYNMKRNANQQPSSVPSTQQTRHSENIFNSSLVGKYSSNLLVQHKESNIDAKTLSSAKQIPTEVKAKSTIEKNITEIVDSQVKTLFYESRKGRLFSRIHRQKSPETDIAFYVYLSTNEPSPGRHQTLLFDTVNIDTAHAYNKISGIFTIPREGLYFFTWSVRSGCHSTIHSEIVKNNDSLGVIAADSDEVCDSAFATGISLTYANAGDLIFIRTVPNLPIKGSIASNYAGYTSFSGFIIIPTA